MKTKIWRYARLALVAVTLVGLWSGASVLTIHVWLSVFLDLRPVWTSGDAGLVASLAAAAAYAAADQGARGAIARLQAALFDDEERGAL